MRAQAVYYFTIFRKMAAKGLIEHTDAFRRSRLYLVEPDTYGTIGDGVAERIAEIGPGTWNPWEVLGEIELPFDSLFIVTGSFHEYQFEKRHEAITVQRIANLNAPHSCGWLLWVQDGRLNLVAIEVNPETRQYCLTPYCRDNRWDEEMPDRILVACLELHAILTLINMPSVVEEALFTSKEKSAYQQHTGKQLSKAFRIVNAPKVVTERATNEAITVVKASQERIAHSRRASQHLRIVPVPPEDVDRYIRRGYRCYPCDKIPEGDQQEITRRGPNKSGQVPTEGWVGLKYYPVSAAEIGGREDPAVPLRLIRT